MSRKLLWGALGAVVLVLIAAIGYISLSGGIGAIRQAEAPRPAVRAPTTLPTTNADAAGTVAAPRAQSQVAAAPRVMPMTGDSGQSLGIAVAISFVFSLIAAFVGGWLGRRKLLGQLSQLRSDMDRIKASLNAERSRAAAGQSGGYYDGQVGGLAPQDGSSSFQQGGSGFSQIPRSKPTGLGTIPSTDAYTGGGAMAQPVAAPAPPSPPPPTVSPVDRQQQADLAVLDFQSQFQQFLAGANVSQKAFDSFVSQFGRTRLVQAVESGQVQLATEAMGTEKLLALQLTGHDRFILLPSFYFISDFSSSFAKSRDVPREIKAAYDIVGGGSGQLRINRLGLLQQQGGVLHLAEPRGELTGFID